MIVLLSQSPSSLTSTKSIIGDLCILIQFNASPARIVGVFGVSEYLSRYMGFGGLSVTFSAGVGICVGSGVGVAVGVNIGVG